ncbi:MAG TPA: SDR family oxidoreductase [Steroidobacteraceae bacterium]|jgi:NAD(P)-dependent dehydrogenase (short-subunit alcohol dehydrogenase family)
MNSLHPTPVPGLAEDDVATCVRVLKAIEADRSHLTRLPQEQRRELLTLAGLIAKPERHDLVRMAKAFRRAERAAEKEHDRKVIEQTGLRTQRRAPAYSPLWLEPPPPDRPEDEAELRQQRACYVCKQPFTKPHRYYDCMCVECGEFNYAKRELTADLSGHYALVTGARVKIGYQASLKLLRAGAHVVVTTRFPVDAADRYAREPDFASFQERLQIHGLDLRHTPSVEIFARFLLEHLPRLDYILNNACQTVRRPVGFYQHLRDRETQSLTALPSAQRNTLAGYTQLRQALATSHPHGPALAQKRYLDEDFKAGEALFPANRYDEDGQQVDLRDVNSWRLRLHEVETPELLEVHLVNAIAPYILNARLKPLLVRTPGAHKHIVNVSAMEGQFYRTTKTDRHPHTNMAKAALNMMTRTSAPDFVKDGINMNAVDTGWVTDEDPAVHAARKAELGFAPPLDIIDGAARIVDPVFVGRLTGAHVWGQFLKDYKPTPW